jgi:hypothetical protein
MEHEERIQDAGAAGHTGLSETSCSAPNSPGWRASCGVCSSPDDADEIVTADVAAQAQDFKKSLEGRSEIKKP